MVEDAEVVVVVSFVVVVEEEDLPEVPLHAPNLVGPSKVTTMGLLYTDCW